MGLINFSKYLYSLAVFYNYRLTSIMDMFQVFPLVLIVHVRYVFQVDVGANLWLHVLFYVIGFFR